jgi:dTDP-4-amino-4,6-dideoxygalactose transaminase
MILQERIPRQPILSGGTFSRYRGESMPSIEDAGEAALLTSGRVAIAQALTQIKVAAGDQVLLPAFHSSSMVAPVLWAGATPIFYKIKGDCSVDLADVEAKLTTRTRVLLIVHYFGFPQDVVALRAFCDRRGLYLLEDCAHAYFGSFAGEPPGSFGDFACASPMKFFPTYDGGCLISSRRPMNGTRLSSGGWGFEAKSLLNALERSFEHRRLSPMRLVMGAPMRVKDKVWRKLKSPGKELAPVASDGGHGFNAHWVGKRMSIPSQFILRFASRARIVTKRRANYGVLLDALSAVTGARPLFLELPRGVVPYVFPLLVHDPEAIVPALKRAGVPIFRWDHLGSVAEVCRVSHRYSQHVLQLPCHQELSAGELEWMVRTIRALV